METVEIVSLINTGGVVAVLVFQAALFLRGDIVSKKVVDAIVRATVEALLDELIIRDRLQQIKEATTQLDNH